MPSITATLNRALPSSFTRQVEGDAAGEGVSPRWTWIIFWIPLTVGAVLAATYVHFPLFVWLHAEDHPIEWSQFALCLFASVTAGLAAVQFARKGAWADAALFLLFALGAFVLAGEEISWAQRVFGFGTPSSLARVNHQDEFNVHDINSGIPIEEMFRLVQLAISLGGAVLPFLTRTPRPLLKGSLWRLLTPPWYVVLFFFAAFAYRSVRLVSPWQFNALVVYQEWFEFCLYFGLAALALSGYSQAWGRSRNPFAPTEAAQGAPGSGGEQPLRRPRGVARALRPGTSSGLNPLAAPVIAAVAAGCTAITVLFAVLTMWRGFPVVN